MPPVSERLDEILSTLRTLVSFDVRTLFDNNSALLPVALWPAGASLAVSSIQSRELFSGYGDNRVLIGVKHNVKLSDRVKALQLAMAEAGLLTDRPPPPGREPIGAVTYEVIEQMTDAELAHRLVATALSRAGTPSPWEDATDAEIDADFAKIVACYDAASARGACPGRAGSYQQRAPTEALVGPRSVVT
jgi:hypothetical protein